MPDNTSTYYDCNGGGFGLGSQILFGAKKNGTFDFAFGLKFVYSESNVSDNNNDDYLDYYGIGPASIIDGIIAIGFKF